MTLLQVGYLRLIEYLNCAVQYLYKLCCVLCAVRTLALQEARLAVEITMWCSSLTAAKVFGILYSVLRSQANNGLVRLPSSIHVMQ